MLDFRRAKSAADDRQFQAALADPENTTILSMAGCNIDVLPPSVGRLSALEQLVVFNNKLSTLPAELAQVTRLTLFHGQTNRFSEIPDVLFELPELRQLYLDRNPLSRIPGEFTKLIPCVIARPDRGAIRPT